MRDPTPSQVAIANERWERLVDGQPDRYRLVLDMLRLGHTHEEIAERTGLHRKVIQRLLHKMAQRRDFNDHHGQALSLRREADGDQGRSGCAAPSRTPARSWPSGPNCAADNPSPWTWPTTSFACAARPARRRIWTPFAIAFRRSGCRCAGSSRPTRSLADNIEARGNRARVLA